MIVLDTSVLYALLDRREPRHPDVSVWYRSCSDGLVTTPLVLAEIDYLVTKRLGAAAAAAVRRDIAAEAYDVEWWPEAATTMAEIAERHADSGLSLTDASLLALADRLDTTRIATFDERHFRAARPHGGAGAFTLLPLDA